MECKLRYIVLSADWILVTLSPILRLEFTAFYILRLKYWRAVHHKTKHKMYSHICIDLRKTKSLMIFSRILEGSFKMHERYHIPVILNLSAEKNPSELNICIHLFKHT